MLYTSLCWPSKNLFGPKSQNLGQNVYIKAFSHGWKLKCCLELPVCTYPVHGGLKSGFAQSGRPYVLSKVLSTELKDMEQQYITLRITNYELVLLCTYIPGWPNCRLEKKISEKFARSNFELLYKTAAIAVSNINLLKVTFTRNAFKTVLWSPWYWLCKQTHVYWLTRRYAINQCLCNCAE